MTKCETCGRSLIWDQIWCKCDWVPGDGSGNHDSPKGFEVMEIQNRKKKVSKKVARRYSKEYLDAMAFLESERRLNG